MQPVLFHFIRKRTGIADEVFPLKNCGCRRQKCSRHADPKPAISPAASADPDAVHSRFGVPRIVSDLKDLRPDLFYISLKLDRILSAGRDKEFLHILLIPGILRKSPVQHLLLIRDQRLREFLPVEQSYRAAPVLISQREKTLCRSILMRDLPELLSGDLRRDHIGLKREPVLTPVGYDPDRPFADVSFFQSSRIKAPADPVRVLRKAVPPQLHMKAVRRQKSGHGSSGRSRHYKLPFRRPSGPHCKAELLRSDAQPLIRNIVFLAGHIDSRINFTISHILTLRST